MAYDAFRRIRDQYADLIAGNLAWDDADLSVRSMARLPIHQAAVKIRDAESQDKRRNMLGRIPESIRPHVKKRVEEIWAHRK